MRKIVLLVVVLVAGLSVGAQVTYQMEEYHLVGSLYYHITSDSTVEVAPPQNCAVYPREIVVPERVEIDGRRYIVTRIGDEAFAGQCGASSVELPPTLLEIGREAFTSFPTEVVLPESVRRIEFGAFAYAQMEEFYIPQNVEQIEEAAFCGMEVYRFVVEEDNVHYAALDSVALCSRDTTLLLAYALGRRETSYVVPRPVRRIAASAFYGSRTLRAVELPEGLREIGGSAFGVGLEGLHIPVSVSRIEGVLRDTASADFALTVDRGNRCYKVEGGMLMSYEGDTLVMMMGAEGEVHVPSGTRVIGNGVFQYNTRLSHVYLPEGVTEIGEGAFAVSSANVKVPSTLVSIGEQAFYGNTGTQRISIPRLTRMGRCAFQFSAITVVDSALQLRVVPQYAFSDSRLNTFNWGDLLEAVEDYAFYAVPMFVGSKVLPVSLKRIGIKAFSTRNRIKSITFMGAVDSIGEYGLRCRVVHLRDAHVPAIHPTALLQTDTVYTPCGQAEDFEQAIEHGETTVFAEWCGEVGVERHGALPELTLYPNPSHGSVTLAGLPGEGSVVVRDMMGREVLRRELPRQTQAYTFRVADYPSGTYFVTLTNAKGTSTQKLVVE